MNTKKHLFIPIKGYIVVTVFIIASHLMFSRGLESMLRQENTLKVLGQEQDAARAVEQIKVLRPDVVIIYGDDKSKDLKATIIDVLNVSPNSKVVGLNLQNNISFIYQAARWAIEDVSELVELINNQAAGQKVGRSKHSFSV